MSKTTLGVIFGGRSVEHDVSIVTACQVMEAIDKRRYKIVPIYIAKDGQWYTGEKLSQIETFRQGTFTGKQTGFIPPVAGYRSLVNLSGNKKLFRKESLPEIDLAFPLTHGTQGEDGCLQGLLELANIPYIGSGVQSSALGMDKIFMKSLFSDAGLPTVEYMWFYAKKWNEKQDNITAHVEGSLGYPVVVKPATLGSSIGIKLAKNRNELGYAIGLAARYDRRIIIEKVVANLLEVNCSVLGVDSDLQASLCEQPLSQDELLSFQDKYLTTGQGAGVKGGRNQPASKIPAPLLDETAKTIQDMAQAAFSTIDARGTARIDFLVNKETQDIYVNEINTIPGSLSMRLWEKSGVKAEALINRLIGCALKTHEEKNRLVYTYSSNLLQQPTKGLPGKGRH